MVLEVVTGIQMAPNGANGANIFLGQMFASPDETKLNVRGCYGFGPFQELL